MGHFLACNVSLFLFLVLPSLPVTASLPVYNDPTQPGFLDLLSEARQSYDTSAVDSAYGQRQQSLMNTVVENLSAFDDPEEEDADTLSPEEDVEEIQKRTAEEMEKILDRIYSGVLTVEKGRKMMVVPPTPPPTPPYDIGSSTGQRQASGVRPSSYFVRIGRSGRKSQYDSDEGSVQASSLQDPQNPSISNSVINPKSVVSQHRDRAYRNSRKNGAGNPQEEKPDEPSKDESRRRRSLHPTKRRDKKYSPRSRYMRYGRTPTATSLDGDDSRTPARRHLSDILFPDCGLSLNGFLRIGRRGTAESEEQEAMERYMNQLSKLAGTSFVRIGRLPSSAFRQGISATNTGLLAGSLALRRSPGFRLTKNGVIRMGKRPSC
ncbi:uncharacterized protein LOC143286529 [Babylonia areolata]|uniref:uncharacterized protein LOC143286529 n=1 Tax=Babylonia areolata TaxID=304850 RepID=UPI003FD61848